VLVKDLKFFIIHETFENLLMRQQKLNYEQAHKRANELETYLRRKEYKPL